VPGGNLIDSRRPDSDNGAVQRIKITDELRDRAWQDFYVRNRRVLTLTEGQRRHISRVTKRRTAPTEPHQAGQT
jgi:hypothetical protein